MRGVHLCITDNKAKAASSFRFPESRKHRAMAAVMMVATAAVFPTLKEDLTASKGSTSAWTAGLIVYSAKLKESKDNWVISFTIGKRGDFNKFTSF